MVQVIDIQKGKYTLLINDIRCVFMPMSLFRYDSFMPITPFVPNGKSVIKWKVNGKQISYKQIKDAIHNYINVNQRRLVCPKA